MTSVKQILLHVGMAKSGSTALQHAFRQNADALLAGGVLYPEVSSSKVSHKFLAFRLRDDEELPTQFRNLHGNDPARKEQLFRHDWQQVRQQVERHRPHTLLLSSEHLFYGFDRGRGRELRDTLAEISPAIRVVAYLRQPSAYYLSGAQQTLKGTAPIPAPAPVGYREVLEQCAALFPTVDVIPFDRAQLAGGDVVNDFYQRFLPDIGQRPRAPASTVNESLGAESMAVLQEYLRTIHPGKARVKMPDNRRLIDYVRFVERHYDLHSRPVLQPAVADYIDHASTDLLWLRDRYQLQFPGIDPARIAARDNPWANSTRIDEICVIDRARQAELQMRIFATLLATRIPLPFPLLNWLVELGARQPALAPLARRLTGLDLPRRDS